MKERGATLIELMISLAVLTVIIGGMLLFLISHGRMTSGTFHRSDIQRGGRAALSIMEDKIGVAGLGIPRHLAIKGFGTETCGAVDTQRLEVASLDFIREYSVSATDGNMVNGTITLDPIGDMPANPAPQGTVGDREMPSGAWLFLYRHGGKDAVSGRSGHGFVRVGTSRAPPATTISIDATNFSDAQSQLDLSVTGELNARGSSTRMLVGDISTFGIDCSNASHPYLYWEQAGQERTPIAGNVDLRPAGGVVGVRFRFLLDSDGDGAIDDRNGNNEIDDGDFFDTVTINADLDVATHDDVVAIEVFVRLRAEREDQQLKNTQYDSLRPIDFVRLIQVPNVHTSNTTYVFISNAGI